MCSARRKENTQAACQLSLRSDVQVMIRYSAGMPDLLNLARKIMGYMFFDDSYENYYTSQIWDHKYSCGHNFEHPKEDGRYTAITSLMREYAHEREILDAGCGDGLLEDKARSSGLRIIGIDYSAVAIAKARQRKLENC